MVQEPLGVGGGYWLPAGRVDPGEKLTAVTAYSGITRRIIITYDYYEQLVDKIYLLIRISRNDRSPEKYDKVFYRINLVS